ncbi:MAG: hypothetical protein IIA89_15215 [Chloroflexi bacterium]|nr:hypothetical protein [Chloroflexota bacterium]
MQWLVLRRQVSWAGWWVAANLAGWAIGALVNLPLGLASGWIVGLFVASIFQWLVLRRHIYRATWWLLASLVAWVAGVAISVALSECRGPCSGAVFGAVVGGITGIALAWLLRQPAQPRGEADEA